MTLRDLIVTDAKNALISSDDFAETVTYVPYNFAGRTVRAEREIKAVVIRQQLQIFSEDGNTVVPQFEVHVANDETVGISSEEIDLGGDAIKLAPRDGKAVETRSVTHLLQQDHGMLVLQCQ